MKTRLISAAPAQKRSFLADALQTSVPVAAKLGESPTTAATSCTTEPIAEAFSIAKTLSKHVKPTHPLVRVKN